MPGATALLEMPSGKLEIIPAFVETKCLVYGLLYNYPHIQAAREDADYLHTHTGLLGEQHVDGVYRRR